MPRGGPDAGRMGGRAGVAGGCVGSEERVVFAVFGDHIPDVVGEGLASFKPDRDGRPEDSRLLKDVNEVTALYLALACSVHRFKLCPTR